MRCVHVCEAGVRRAHAVARGRTNSRMDIMMTRRGAVGYSCSLKSSTCVLCAWASFGVPYWYLLARIDRTAAECGMDVCGARCCSGASASLTSPCGLYGSHISGDMTQLHTALRGTVPTVMRYTVAPPRFAARWLQERRTEMRNHQMTNHRRAIRSCSPQPDHAHGKYVSLKSLVWTLRSLLLRCQRCV